MQRKKRFLSVFILLAVFLTAPVYAGNINVSIEGQPVVFADQQPANVDGRTLVPVRGVFETIGFDVDWEAETSTAVLSNADYVVRITIGSSTFTTNGASHTLDVPAQSIGGRTMLPLRAVLESVGYYVGWDGATSTVLISSQPLEQPAPPEQPAVSVGEIIRFGEYDWQVLDVQGSRALLLSEHVIEIPYHYTWEDVTWETSSIREHLNNEFFNGFSAADRERIASTTVVNNDNPWIGTPGGNDTTDRIFLLSLDEVVQYFGDSGMLARGVNENERDWYLEWPNQGIYGWGIHDQFSEARMAHNAAGSHSWWWLRSPGEYSYSAARVNFEGDITVHGHDVDETFAYSGARPALWLNLED